MPEVTVMKVMFVFLRNKYSKSKKVFEIHRQIFAELWEYNTLSNYSKILIFRIEDAFCISV